MLTAEFERRDKRIFHQLYFFIVEVHVYARNMPLLSKLFHAEVESSNSLFNQ
jgi:hypothetical protein